MTIDQVLNINENPIGKILNIINSPNLLMPSPPQNKHRSVNYVSLIHPT